MIEHVAGLILTTTLNTSPLPVTRPVTTTTIAPSWRTVADQYRDMRFERFRSCIAYRESENIPTIVNRRSNAQGLYQFLPQFWDRWLRNNLHLNGTRYATDPIHSWPRALQDAAFWRALNHGKGTSAWSGGRYDCTHYLP